MTTCRFAPQYSLLDWLNDPVCDGVLLSPEEEVLVKDVLRRALCSRGGSLPEMLERATHRLDKALDAPLPETALEVPDTRKHRDLQPR